MDFDSVGEDWVQNLQALGEEIGIQWDEAEFTVDDFIDGFQVEMEHGPADPETDVTGGDPEMTAKIAWAHLKEDPEYYKKLQKVESAGREASLSRQAITIGELQKKLMPQFDHLLSELDWAVESEDKEAAMGLLNQIHEAFVQVKEKVDSLGDVDPVVFGEAPKKTKRPLFHF